MLITSVWHREVNGDVLKSYLDPFILQQIYNGVPSVSLHFSSLKSETVNTLVYYCYKKGEQENKTEANKEIKKLKELGTKLHRNGVRCRFLYCNCARKIAVLYF